MGGAIGEIVFISYRRGDAAWVAGRLFDALEGAFGRDRLFMDVDSIRPGEEFPSILRARVEECSVMLALIGQHWVTVTDASGRRRLDNADDFVRIEISSGLAQGKVIPVLIDDVAMPVARDLPEDLKALANIHASRLRHDLFGFDSQRLIGDVKKLLQKLKKSRREGAAQRPAQAPVASMGAETPEAPRPPGSGDSAGAPVGPAHRKKVSPPPSAAEKELNGATARDVGKKPRRHTPRIPTFPEPRKVDNADSFRSIEGLLQSRRLWIPPDGAETKPVQAVAGEQKRKLAEEQQRKKEDDFSKSVKLGTCPACRGTGTTHEATGYARICVYCGGKGS